MTRTEKALNDLVMRIQSVLWELEGYQETDVAADPQRPGTGVAEALERIDQVERSKLRVREAEAAARRAGKAVAQQLHPLFGLVFAELSTAEFAAKDALQKHQPHAVGPLIDDGYARAVTRCLQPLKDAWTELQGVAHGNRSA